MCDFTKGIRLCKCNSETIRYRDQDRYRIIRGESVKYESKRNAKIPLIYVWRLYRYAGKTFSSEIGRYLVPSDNIGNGLDEEWIQLNLNYENCFDFDYVPQEGDNLEIAQNVKDSRYLSFIFKNGEWVADNYDPFQHDRTRITRGKVKPVDEP
jgi:hypothetical protein